MRQQQKQTGAMPMPAAALLSSCLSCFPADSMAWPAGGPSGDAQGAYGMPPASGAAPWVQGMHPFFRCALAAPSQLTCCSMRPLLPTGIDSISLSHSPSQPLHNFSMLNAAVKSLMHVEGL